MTPWQLAATSEHSHQRAFFAWANCAAQYGFGPASVAETYKQETRQDALDAFGIAGSLIGGNQSLPVPALAFMFAIPNGGKRDQITAGKLKAEGVKPGVPDVMLPVTVREGYPIRYAGLFLEFKKPSERPKNHGAGGIRKGQSEYHDFLLKAGYQVAVVYSWEDARQAVIDYLR